MASSALVKVARSLLAIIWHLLADRATFHGLGWDYHLNRLDTGKKIRNHVRRLEALGLTVILTKPLTYTDPRLAILRRGPLSRWLRWLFSGQSAGNAMTLLSATVPTGSS
ncbi:hypothetical protein GCM10009850_038960 [Nonomuraea monospora]|uniref:Transposase n=2 Tax=Nonomuraea monospora TaxID=568818 RepID=A0ABP5P9U7_9ACTN